MTYLEYIKECCCVVVDSFEPPAYPENGVEKEEKNSRFSWRS